MYTYLLTLFFTTGTILTGTMDYFLKHGRTQLLQILMLKEHLGIMILVMNFLFVIFDKHGCYAKSNYFFGMAFLCS
jgi:hypothetical protein